MTKTRDLIKASIFAVLALFITYAAPLNIAAAAAADPVPAPTGNTTSQATQITNILCNAVNQLTGNIGRSIATLIIISLAISLFLGKVSWGLAIATAVGMGILFGANDVVNLLAGQQSPCS